MEREKSELRTLLDLFEGAGFMVTYYLDGSTVCIAIKSQVIKNIIDDYEKEPASAGEVVALVEQNNYRLLTFKTGIRVISDYGGTIYIEIKIIPAETSVMEQALSEH